MADRAPLVLFAYNRPRHLDATIRSLIRCDGFADIRVIIFGDGPKSDADRELVDETRSVVRRHFGSSAEMRFAPANRGLAASIVAGLAEITERFGSAIVLEDDLLVSKNYLLYMNEALERYARDERVLQIAGHMFEVPEFADRRRAVFLPLTTTWGWATWARAWRHFDASAQGWRSLRTDAGMRWRFNLCGAYDYAGMLERQMSGNSDSWGIRWYWSVFRRGGLVCFPPRSLVRNIGMDGSGTHGRGRLRSFRDDLRDDAYQIDLPQTPAAEDSEVQQIRAAIRRQNGGWMGAVADAIRRRMRYLRSEV